MASEKPFVIDIKKNVPQIVVISIPEGEEDGVDFEQAAPPELKAEVKEITRVDILEEEWYDSLDLVAQLVEAEAGNQDLVGKQYVADVVFNRVESELFPNTIEEVIFQKNPVQFAVTVNGMFEAAAYDISEETFEAVRLEAFGDRLDTGILYFGTGKYNGHGFWQHGDHWFSY